MQLRYLLEPAVCSCFESSLIPQTCLRSRRPGGWAVAPWSTCVVLPAQRRFLMVGKVEKESRKTHSPDVPECAGETGGVAREAFHSIP